MFPILWYHNAAGRVDGGSIDKDKFSASLVEINIIAYSLTVPSFEIDIFAKTLQNMLAKTWLPYIGLYLFWRVELIWLYLFFDLENIAKRIRDFGTFFLIQSLQFRTRIITFYNSCSKNASTYPHFSYQMLFSLNIDQILLSFTLIENLCKNQEE